MRVYGVTPTLHLLHPKCNKIGIDVTKGVKNDKTNNSTIPRHVGGSLADIQEVLSGRRRHERFSRRRNRDREQIQGEYPVLRIRSEVITGLHAGIERNQGGSK